MNWTECAAPAFCFVVVGLTIVAACDNEIKKAHAEGRPDLVCADVSFGDGPGERCENAEVICYTKWAGKALSCVRKAP